MFEKLKIWYDERPEREKKMLIGMGITFAFIIIFVVTMESIKTFGESRDKIDAMKATLDYVYDGQDNYLAEKAKQVEMEKSIEGEEFDVSNFLRKKAQEHGVQIRTSGSGTSRSLSSSDGADSDLVEEEIKVDSTQNVDHASMMKFFVSISESDKPVFIRQINIKRANRSASRRGSAQSGNAANLTFNIVVSTFVPKTDEE